MAQDTKTPEEKASDTFRQKRALARLVREHGTDIEDALRGFEVRCKVADVASAAGRGINGVLTAEKVAKVAKAATATATATVENATAQG